MDNLMLGVQLADVSTIALGILRDNIMSTGQQGGNQMQVSPMQAHAVCLWELDRLFPKTNSMCFGETQIRVYQ